MDSCLMKISVWRMRLLRRGPRLEAGWPVRRYGFDKNTDQKEGGSEIRQQRQKRDRIMRMFRNTSSNFSGQLDEEKERKKRT